MSEVKQRREQIKYEGPVTRAAPAHHPRKQSIYSCRRQCPIIVTSFLIILAFTYLMSPTYIDPVKVELPSLVKLDGPLKVNNKLTNSQKLFNGRLRGPESIAYFEGSFYAGQLNGFIIKWNESGLFNFSRLVGGHALSDNLESINTCGRPLGLRIDKDRRRLIVADAYLGYLLTMVIPFCSNELAKGSSQKLFPKEFPYRVTCIDDIDILPDGRILVSEASDRFPLHNFMYALLDGRPNGRLLLVYPNSSWDILVDGIFFANGVQLHSDGSTVLLAETGTSRILRVSLDGTGDYGIFSDQLPGFPDNIRESSKGGYWVALGSTRHSEAPSVFDRLSNWPSIRFILHKRTFVDYKAERRE
ncbi:unnamed protein product [Protopolystoma xenopodis]|uniref:Strictosidine synthase conserved region domain-containing protein n=1 Tax=Protopolystoma xenopodis TaxID=117903 RepID=A0A448WX08_9PLAT|nr:unnamed protein product [Protopolystoma xenopodis]